ncbi:gp53-like domain-containing protein [Acidiphilium multivorum]|uniref:gp53-like domain-containing protein n=1 Tax=Acidiphilium multivorum TaxID=62140 RepID=UPI001B8B2D30|nr:hypothetical protein [Acidiphilium multivorum]MBS3025572.1 hypothetical protein [Acidiphilium multivorum]
MYWTDGAYSVIVNGNPQFQDANPAQGIPIGTFWSAAWANNVTNELINLVQGAGLTPSQTDQTQVFKAVKALVAAGIFIGGAVGYAVSTTLTDADANNVIFFTGSTAATYTLPASNSAGAYALPIVISNQGNAPLTIAPAAGEGIDLASAVLEPGQVCALINDGSAAWHHLWAENGTSGQFFTGRLGVGTAAPAYEMDVVGQVRFVTDNTGGPGSGTLIVQDQGASGANIVMNGNVISGQPETKYLRVLNGNFEIINNAYSAQILGLDDSGNLSVAGKITGGAYASGADDAVLLGQFNVSNSAGSGYAVLPNGLILQWGNQTLPASNTSYTYNFPIAFPNACVGFGTATKSASAPTTSALGSVLNNSQYSLTNNATIANSPQFWFAIGY